MPELAPYVAVMLLHFLWQATVIAACLAILLPICRSPVARCNLNLAAVMLMAGTPLVTVVLGQLGMQLDHQKFSTITTVLEFPISEVRQINVSSGAGAQWCAWLLLLWLAGIAVQSVRLALGWSQVRQLRKGCSDAIPQELSEKLRNLGLRLDIQRDVQYYSSSHQKAPAVVGWLRPIVLLPAGLEGRVSAVQFDALLTHELEHIRRLDPLGNVLLLIVETLYFFHPAVWWVTNNIRVEREYCCDDTAVSVVADPATYVEALASLERSRLRGPTVIAATAGNLVDRSKRLLSPPVSDSIGRQRSVMAGLLAVYTIVGAVTLLAATPTLSDAEDAEMASLMRCRVDTKTDGCRLTWTRTDLKSGAVIVRARAQGADGKPIYLALVQTTGVRTEGRRIACNWKRTRSSTVVGCMIRKIAPNIPTRSI